MKQSNSVVECDRGFGIRDNNKLATNSIWQVLWNKTRLSLILIFPVHETGCLFLPSPYPQSIGLRCTQFCSNNNASTAEQTNVFWVIFLYLNFSMSFGECMMAVVHLHILLKLSFKSDNFDIFPPNIWWIFQLADIWGHVSILIIMEMKRLAWMTFQRKVGLHKSCETVLSCSSYIG